MAGPEREQDNFRLDPLFASRQEGNDTEGSREELLAQLRRMKRQKTEIEGEFEAATHRWQSERRE